MSTNIDPEIAALDFAMMDAPERRTEVVAVEHGHRLVAATITWHPYGGVFLTMECLGGMSVKDARDFLRAGVEGADDSRPAVRGLPARGIQVATGRAFARSLSRALSDRTAWWR